MAHSGSLAAFSVHHPSAFTDRINDGESGCQYLSDRLQIYRDLNQATYLCWDGKKINKKNHRVLISLQKSLPYLPENNLKQAVSRHFKAKDTPSLLFC